jgi:hypothetical protein
MSDGRANNGGARAGAGRKAKQLEDDLHERLLKALKKGRRSRLDDIFAKLVEDAMSPSFKVRHAARAMLFDRLYGRTKPPETNEVEDEGGTYIVRVPVRLSAEEWQQQAKPPDPPPSQ